MNALGTANILRGLTLEQQRTLLDLFTRSAGDMLDDWFESDLVKALFGFDAIVGNYASPYAAGSAYVMLHHAFGEVNGKKGVWGHAIGGMGAITQAMASAARAHGAEIETDAGVREVIVERDRAVGVILEGGETIRAKYVASNVNPKLLYTRLMPADALPTPFLDRIKTWRNGSGTFRINVALSALPSFTALPGDGDHLTAGIIIGPSLGYMDRAWLDARQHGWSREPVVEILIPSTLDDALMLEIQQLELPGVSNITPGIRSLQIQYEPRLIALTHLLRVLIDAEERLGGLEDFEIPSRTVWLPFIQRPGRRSDDHAVHGVRAGGRTVVPGQHRIHPPHQRPRPPATTCAVSSSMHAIS